MRRSRGGLHRRRASSSSPSGAPHQQLMQAEVGVGMADGQAGPLLHLGLLNQPPPYRRPPSSSPLYRLDAAGDLTYSMDVEDEKMVLVQPCSSPSCSTNPATYSVHLPLIVAGNLTSDKMKLVDVVNGTEYVPTYEDKEGN